MKVLLKHIGTLISGDIAEPVLQANSVFIEDGLGGRAHGVLGQEIWLQSHDAHRGTSIPGSSTVTAEQVMAIDPDIVSHINGGPTAVSPGEIRKLVTQINYWLELVHCGNNVAANIALEEAVKAEAIIGNDAPSGTGVVSLGILRMITHAASLGGVEAPVAMCMATGNPAKAFGLNRGVIAKGREADLVVMDAPMGSYGTDAMSAMTCGDIPGVSLILVDGKITVNTSRNTPPATRKPVIS